MSCPSFDDASDRVGFTILTVCTGNICRSPLAESLLRLLLGGLPVTVHSAGTHAMAGDGMTPQNQRIASDLGVQQPQTHRAKQLSLEHLREADLVLALGREHRRAIVELLPRASRQTFTLREFARLAQVVTADDLEQQRGSTPIDHLRGAVEAAALLRGTIPPLENPSDDDVVDPYRQSDEVYRLSADQLVPAVHTTALLLRRSVTGVA